jgi:mono/diheme cytochrome c family protein
MSRFSLFLTGLGLVGAVALTASLGPVLAQGANNTVGGYLGVHTTENIWDGVYSDEQADKGAILYRTACSNCHGKQLEGVPDEGFPALAAPGFMVEWDGQSVADLVAHVHVSPHSRREDMDPVTAVALTAFILNQNNVPSGKALSTEAGEQAKIAFTQFKPEKK